MEKLEMKLEEASTPELKFYSIKRKGKRLPLIIIDNKYECVTVHFIPDRMPPEWKTCSVVKACLEHDTGVFDNLKKTFPNEGGAST